MHDIHGKFNTGISMVIREKMTEALYAGILGDALGIPVGSSSRQQLALCAVKNMFGYGRWDQPEGTWSDDSSLTLCTMESLTKGYDVEDLGKTFCKWIFDGHLTSTGFVFDAGLTTFMALDRIRNDGASARLSGCIDENDIGNGSLMRMLPAAFFFAAEPTESFLYAIHEISAITHAHPRAKLGCGIYSLLVRELLLGGDKTLAYRSAIDQAAAYYGSQPEFKNQLDHFGNILEADFASLDAERVKSTGYIVDTLEASVWCLLNHTNTKDVILAAVQLGMETDTTGMLAGGLAGLCYGLKDVPDEWLQSLARKPDIDALIQNFIAVIMRKAIKASL
jgi:ADP-ribosyl-[dinitrogen reductase] hydrolase